MREAAFFLVFESIFIKDSVDEIIETAKECEEIKLNEQSVKIFEGVISNQETIDKLIVENLKNWSIERLSKVCLAVLRVSIYEMVISKDVDVGIAINEAVEITKIYSTQDDANYVNGVLGGIARGQ
jgi:N utilization substance protein B